MQSLLPISLYVHILAACVWIGGSIFLAAIFVPMLRDRELGRHAVVLFGPAARRFRTIGWTCLLLLVITGFVNMYARSMNFHSVEFWTGDFGKQIGWKILLLAVIAVLGLFHDLVAGPKAVAARKADPKSATYQKWRLVASWIGRLNLLLSLVILWIAVGLFH